MPVQTPQRILGVISLARDPQWSGAEQDMALLFLLADQATLILASVEAFGSLERVLLAAVAETAAGGDLVLALRQVADGLPTADARLRETKMDRGARPCHHRETGGGLGRFAGPEVSAS